MYSFTIMNKNQNIADISIQNGKLVSCEIYDSHSPFFYREGINITMELVYSFLESRVPPRDRDNIKDILNFYGLQEYDVYALCKRTHGIDQNDNCWIKFDGEQLIWEDVKPQWRA